MKTLKIFTIFIIVSIFISCEQKQNTPQNIYDETVKSDDLECDKETLQVVSVIAELGKFRSSNENPFSQSDDVKIRQLVEQLKSKESLIAFAKLTRTLTIYPTNSGECFRSRIDESYSRAFWDSIEILAQDRSEKNLQEMEFLKKELNIDGGDSYDWSTIVYRIPAP